MTDKLKAIETKTARGRILRLLHIVYPGPAEGRTITNIMIQEGRPVADMAKYIDYLVHKGYVKAISEEHAEQILKGVVPPTAFFKLTPHGVDLLEGTIKDPGVDLGHDV